MHSVQVHYENGGQLTFDQEIDDPDDWLDDTCKSDFTVVKDASNDRVIAFSTKAITAIIIAEKQPDLFERSYDATNQI